MRGLQHQWTRDNHVQTPSPDVFLYGVRHSPTIYRNGDVATVSETEPSSDETPE